MTTQIANQSCRGLPGGAFWLAIGAICLCLSGCAEIELGSEVYKRVTRGSQSRPAPQVVSPAPQIVSPAPQIVSPAPQVVSPAQQAISPPPQAIVRDFARPDSIEPTLRPDPQAFSANGLALWDGNRTLQGIWITHPTAMIARRVRVTNDETGAKVDAAMFRRDPWVTGPQIIVSSEAAALLGLAPGRGTPLTVEGLAYRADTDDAPEIEVATRPENLAVQLESSGVDAPVESIALETRDPEITKIATADPAPPAEPDVAQTGAPADAQTDVWPIDVIVTAATTSEQGLDAANLSYESQAAVAETPTGTITPTPAPKVKPAEPSPSASGDIPDGQYFVQAGIFSEQANATRLVDQLRAADLLANALPVTLGDRKFTRVLVGPYDTTAKRDAALEIVRRIGPADAIPARG